MKAPLMLDLQTVAQPGAQTSGLLYRRLPVCGHTKHWDAGTYPVPGRPEVCDTADRRSALRAAAAFTMIEIAISLAIIGFALVAIIGILPLGMTAQRDNRQETIVNQDATVLMDAVRNGERGLDDLTNYVIGITNYQTLYTRGTPSQSRVLGYTPTVVTLNGGIAPSQYFFPLTNGYSIIGLLSTPKYFAPQYWPAPFPPPGQPYFSNHVVATFRSMSGPASEKPPQLNPTLQEMALTYRVVADVAGYGTNYWDPSLTNFFGVNTNVAIVRSNLLVNLQANLHDLRLTFLWPILPNGKVGDGRQVYRTMVAGRQTNDPPQTPFFFFEPRTYF